MHVYSKCNSNKIWGIAWMNLVAAFYTMMTPNWHLFFVPLSVFITSLITQLMVQTASILISQWL